MVTVEVAALAAEVLSAEVLAVEVVAAAALCSVAACTVPASRVGNMASASCDKLSMVTSLNVIRVDSAAEAAQRTASVGPAPRDHYANKPCLRHPPAGFNYRVEMVSHAAHG